MLNHLHVKDLALIENAELEFGPGLNILTGETGAGKSILIGSINLALGQKASKDMIRSGKESGFVELVFSDLTERQEVLLRELDIPLEEGQLIIRRRISEKRSEIRLNDQSSTLSKLRKVTELLIDIHGQHEHQSLLKEGAHLHIVDAFGGRETAGIKEELARHYRQYTEARKRMAAFRLSEGQRQREADFLRFEIGEIEGAALREGEEEALSKKQQRYQHAQKITEAAARAAEILREADFSEALSSLTEVLPYDEEGLQGISDSLYDLESIAGDTLRELDRYLDGHGFDEEDARATGERLDLIRTILMKYGGSVQKTLESLQAKQQRLMELEDYDTARKKAEEAARKSKEQLLRLSRQLTKKRKADAEILCQRIRLELAELGFLDVQFEMAFSPLPEPSADGGDEAHFVLSLNPGEPVRPLSEVASGGELSRIMLSIKTVLADTDEIPTLIFDEIDTGISGRTAEKVSDKLKKISKSRQVILITHLPQIAAKADVHFGIEKTVSEGHTTTQIRELSEEESVEELSRLLAGGSVTEAVRANARELKEIWKQQPSDA